MAISKRLRFEILRRDNHACRYCGATAPEAKLTIDHVKPVTLGGGDEPGNLVTACSNCNGGKSSSVPDAPVVDDVAQSALRWGRAMGRAAESVLADHDRRQDVLSRFLANWNDWTYKDWKTGEDRTIELPSGWETSVWKILSAGLPFEILNECIAAAMSARRVKDEFRYMCGCAWNRVDEMQKIAVEIAEAAESVPQGRHHRQDGA